MSSTNRDEDILFIIQAAQYLGEFPEGTSPAQAKADMLAADRRAVKRARMRWEKALVREGIACTN